MKKYKALILKAIFSLILTIAYYVVKEENWLLIIPTWPVVYSVVSLYFHVRKMFKEDNEPEYGYRYYNRNDDPMFGFLLDIVFDILVPNVVFPIMAIAIYFGGSWWLVEKFLPESWHEPVEILIAILGVIAVILYDIFSAKEEIEYEKGRAEDEKKRIEELIQKHIEEEAEEYTYHLDFDDSIYEDDPEQRSAINKYVDYCRSENIPDEVLEMMNIRGMTLVKCMQLKAAHEYGLSIKQIASIAHPELSVDDMERAVYNYLREKSEIEKYLK